jgi:2-polyprenyl-3-methyl-5-hydroxy-6-metoxy-1,4-benzoquinol methylase
MTCYICKHSEFEDIMPYRATQSDAIFLNCRVIKCKKCGLNQINRVFTDAQITDYYKHQYDRDDIYKIDLAQFPKDNLFSVSRGRALAKLYQQHVDSEPQTVLDLGCGFGHLLFGFSQVFPKSRYIGVEYDEKTATTLNQSGFEFLYGGIDDISNLKNSIDILITSHVFEHVVDPHLFVEKCMALLKPGGVLLWEMPNLDIFNLKCERRHSPHICLWDIDTLKHILTEHGLNILSLQTAGKKYDYIDSLDSGLIKKVGLVVRNKLQKANVPVSVSDKNTIGFQLDQYGNNRRNLRVLAKKV